MNYLNYLLKGFGYRSSDDFLTTTFKMMYIKNGEILIALSFTLGLLRELIQDALGLDILVVFVLVLLIVAEWWTGLRADILKRKRKFKSRKFGRMILKIGVYVFILFMLNILATKTEHLSFDGFELNPFKAIFYIMFVAIVFQLLISYLENLAVLGYTEARGLAGVVLRKYNKWFEFDGEKDGDNIE